MEIVSSSRRVTELVPLAERLQALQLLRLVIVVAVGAFAGFATGDVEVGWRALALATAVWGAVALLGHTFWLVLGDRGLWLFGLLLIADGVYLAWLSYATGGSQSPLRYLVLVHLVATTLVASYRTGLKLALWHSLLLWVVYQAQQSGTIDIPRAQAAASGGEIERLATFAALFWLVAIATATFSAMNERELRRRRLDLEELAAMATALEDVTESSDAARALVTSVADALTFERVLLVRLDERHASALAAVPDRGGALDHASTELAEGSLLLRAHRERRTLLVTRAGADDPWLDSLLPDARNLVVTPLIADGGALGALVAERGRRDGARVERRVVKTLEQFTSHGALALRNAMLLEEMQRLAETDGLTRIANRRTFEVTLERELSRAARLNESVSIALLDVDHFKKLNDTYGHQTGDDVLLRVAATLDAATREHDTAARYGGEEFVVVLPHTGVDGAVEIADRLREMLQDSTEEPAITASFGVAAYPDNAATSEELIAAADEALYASKRDGRNRVTASTKQHTSLKLAG